MVVRLRLMRFGCRNRTFYRITASDSKSSRDGNHLEVLGYYNPLSGDGDKRMSLKFDRVKYWLSVGAQPSEPVQRLLFRAGVLPPLPMLAMGHKGGPRDTRLIDPLSGRVMISGQLTNAIDIPLDAEDDENDKETWSTSKYEAVLRQLMLFIYSLLFWGLY